MNNTSYDTLPYPSSVYESTDPAQLGAIASLMGVHSAPAKSARVLELGCGDGANICALAALYRNAEFVGVDLSETHIDLGRERVASTGLANISLQCASIMDIGTELGSFDYIIAHAVYSWVPVDVQKKIIQICKSRLTRTGLVYISYNVLPGWNNIQTVREMMMFHASKFKEPNEQIREARRMLSFVHENVSGSETYRQVLKDEIDLISGSSDSHLFHDHMEVHNTPYYFQEFVSAARAEGLAYVADFNLATLFLGSYSEKARETLSKVKDPGEAEQYLDFLSNRRFRRSILCHADQPVHRSIGPDQIRGLFYFADLKQTGSGDDGATKFATVDGSAWIQSPVKSGISSATSTLSTTTAVIDKILRIFTENRNNPLSVEELTQNLANTSAETQPDDIESKLLNAMPELIVRGVLRATSMPVQVATTVSDAPEVWWYARSAAKSGGVVSNLLHKTIVLDEAVRALMPLMDGTNTFQEILEHYVALCVDGTLTVRENESIVTDRNRLRDLLALSMKELMETLAANALLVR